MRRLAQSRSATRALVALAMVPLVTCASPSSLYLIDRATRRCGGVIAPDASVSSARIAWRIPTTDDDRLASLCDRVGPAVVAPTPLLANDTPADTLLVVSWNTNAGVGDFGGLVDSLTAMHGGELPPTVFLLQEVYRDEQKRSAARARKLDVRDLADAFGFALFYAPSTPDEGAGTDRGNAILSNLPLSAFEAIELPLERQRRVAVAAFVRGRLRDGECWALRVASAQLEPSSSTDGWRAHIRNLFSPRRERQAHALVEALGVAPATVLGGDFQTVERHRDAAIGALHASFPSGTLAPSDQVTHVDRVDGITRRDQFDYLFFRLPNEVVAPPYMRLTRTGDDSEASFFGSDHSPLIGRTPLRALAMSCDLGA